MLEDGRGPAPERSLWQRGNRKIVVHYHVYKNAGTSIDLFLRDSFSDGWVSFERPATFVLSSSDLASFIQARPDILVVSSHVLRPPAPEGLDVFPIALVRHPLDRAYSVYSHSRRGEPTYDTSLVARETDFAGFVQWCVDCPSNGGVVLANYQVIHFSSASFRFPHIFQAVASNADLDEAINFFRSLPCVGVVDRFQDYFVRLRSELSRWAGQPLDGQTPRENTSPERPQLDLTAAVSSAERELGPKLLEKFRAANELDYQLYSVVESMA